MRGRPLTSNRWKVEINQRRRHARALVRIHGGSRGGGGRLRAGRRRLGPGQVGRPARSEEREETRRREGEGAGVWAQGRGAAPPEAKKPWAWSARWPRKAKRSTRRAGPRRVACHGAKG